MATTAPYLHVANGTSTTRTLQAAGVPGLCSIWADPLHDGPVPGGLTDAELVEIRTRHLASAFPQASDPINDLHAWRAVIERDEAYDELVLWFEHDLFDQLNLIQLLAWLRRSRATSRPVSLICIDAFPGRPHFKGLGELTTAELAPLLSTRRPISPAQYDLATEAWDAFRQPSPVALDHLRRADTSPLPFLGAALVRWLQEYPWTRDGLSLNERRLLQLSATGEIALSAVFLKMSEGERAYYVSDLSLQTLAEKLSHTTPSLLTIAQRSQPSHLWFKRSVATTDVGRRVLAGERDRVSLCGIECWLGGVHLQGHDVAWRWDEERGGIVSSSD